MPRNSTNKSAATSTPIRRTKSTIKAKLTSRDHLILGLIEVIPLTAQQVEKFSQTFPLPETSGDNGSQQLLQEVTSGPFLKKKTALRRLQTLARAGYLYNRPYDKDGSWGAERYFQLTRQGWEHIYPDDRIPYPKRQSEAIAPSRHLHTRHLADALVHMACCAHRRGFRMEVLSVESELTIRNHHGSTSLDGELEFVRIDDETVRFHRLIEMECGTHTIRSQKNNKKTWQNRAKVVDTEAADRLKREEGRTRLLTFASGSWRKIETLADLFKEETCTPQRQVYLGTYLHDFLNQEDGLFDPVFLDHHGKKVPALPAWALQPASKVV